MLKKLSIHFSISLALIAPSSFLNATAQPPPPKLTIVFVFDALSARTLDQVDPFITDGIKFLKNNSVNYRNVFHPHANCSSTQGHASLVTGTFPAYHGLVNNHWLGEDNFPFRSIQHNDLDVAGVIDPTTGLIYGTFISPSLLSVLFYYGSFFPLPFVFGVSPHNYRTDTISDQLIISSNNTQSTKVFSVAKDPLVSIIMAGRKGKAIWMDGPSGLFTSSKYYYSTGLPEWVNRFNQEHPVPESFFWEPVYPLGSAAYNFPDAQNYEFSVVIPGFIPSNSTLLGLQFASNNPLFGTIAYNAGPLGIKTTFSFVKELINQELNNNTDRLVIFFNIDSLDIMGGYLGPQTQDAIDVIYRVDRELGDFIRFVYNKVPRSDSLFIFTGDEGLPVSMPELLNQEGFDLSIRTIGDPNLIATLNSIFPMSTPYCLSVIPPFVYLNLSHFTPAMNKEEILSQIKDKLREQPGIKDAWTFDEMISWPFEHEDLARFYKLGLYRNHPATSSPQERRSGEIIFQSLPFNMVTSVVTDDFQPAHGVDHTSPYEYDSHVPLFVYQHGRFAKQTVSEPVIIQQIAISLAEILNVPRPAAASVDIRPLPNLFP